MAILHFTSSSLISVAKDSAARRTRISCWRDSVVKMQKNLIATDSVYSSFSLCPCGRRHSLGEATTPFLPISPSYASRASVSYSSVGCFPISVLSKFNQFLGFLLNPRRERFVMKKCPSLDIITLLGRVEQIASSKARLVFRALWLVQDFRDGKIRERGQ